MEEKPTPGYYGHRQGDKAGTATLDFSVGANAVVHLDYNSSSIGMEFGNNPVRIRKIVLTPDEDHTTHRINGQTIELYKGDTYYQYEQIPADEIVFEKDENGVITITLNEVLESRYVKVNVLFDERDRMYTPEDKAEFINTLAAMLVVYSEATNRTEEYEYDKAGNRTIERVTLVQTDEYVSMYYTNSNRLKTDGTYVFEYDQVGNMVKKGNVFEINGDEVTFIATEGEGVEYWEYSFDLLNRLTEVTKNGTLVAEYTYDALGYRVVKRSNGETIHYVFEGMEAIFEKNITTGEIRSYVYALSKHMACVDGVIGDSAADVYYYHNDHLGSVRAVSDGSGEVVWSADYLAFGKQVDREGQGFGEWHGFTGKTYDSDIGLYYFNARWYDASIGRFVSEDPVRDGGNWYAYANNNPLKFIDPNGLNAALVNFRTWAGGFGHSSAMVQDSNGVWWHFDIAGRGQTAEERTTGEGVNHIKESIKGTDDLRYWFKSTGKTDLTEAIEVVSKLASSEPLTYKAIEFETGVGSDADAKMLEKMNEFKTEFDKGETKYYFIGNSCINNSFDIIQAGLPNMPENGLWPNVNYDILLGQIFGLSHLVGVDINTYEYDETKTEQ